MYHTEITLFITKEFLTILAHYGRCELWLDPIDFQIINFTRPEGGRRISYTSTTDNTVKLFI